jgi:hypothetical protein
LVDTTTVNICRSVSVIVVRLLLVLLLVGIGRLLFVVGCCSRLSYVCSLVSVVSCSLVVVVGCQLIVVGCSLELVVRCQVVHWYWLIIVGYLFIGIGCRLVSVVGYQLIVVGCFCEWVVAYPLSVDCCWQLSFVG